MRRADDHYIAFASRYYESSSAINNLLFTTECERKGGDNTYTLVRCAWLGAKIGFMDVGMRDAVFIAHF